MTTLASISAPTSGIVHTQPETDVYFKDSNKGIGTLYVTQSCVLWMNEGSVGFQLEYPNISLHAISRHVSAFPHECIYLLLNAPDQEPDDGLEDEENADDDSISEIRFVPRDKESLMTIFNAMADCQALHPDEDDVDSDDADPGFYEDADEVQLNAEGQAVLARLQMNLEASQSGGGDAQPNGHAEGESMDTGQFDDADMES